MSGGTLDTASCFKVSSTRLSRSVAHRPMCFDYPSAIPYAVLTPKTLRLLVWPLPRSLATTSGISVDFFSSPYLDVSVRAVPHQHLYLRFQCRLNAYCASGFPHSEIHGSKSAFDSPWLIADCYVLRRLLMPRHSPCALFSLTFCQGLLRTFALRLP